MYCKKMLLAVKKCSTNQICRLSTARIRYTIKYLKDGLIIFTQKKGREPCRQKIAKKLLHGSERN